MEINDEQKEKLEKAFLEEPYRSIKCPICQGKKFSINSRIFMFPDFQVVQVSPLEPQAIFPVVILICEICGHTIMFSAMKLGIIKQKDEGKKI